MVNTRQNSVNGDVVQNIPGTSASGETQEDVNHDGITSEKSVDDKDSDYNPLISQSSSRSSWRRSRYAPSYTTIERVRGLPTRACRMRIVTHVSDDDLDLESDQLFNDEDEPIFTPVKPRRNYGISRPMSRRSAPEAEPAESNQAANGVKEEEDDELEVEVPGVRRSKRQKKLIYDSFNQSWILGSSMYRGYSDIYGSDRDAVRVVDQAKYDVDAAQESANGQEIEQDKPSEMRDAENDEDMYTKVKRTRRPRMRYSPGEVQRGRLRPRERRRVVVDSDTETETEVTSDEGGRRRRSQRRVYHLRQNKPMVDRFQISNIPTRRSSRMLLCSVSRRPFRNQQRRRDSSSSDEERFQRKKALSLAKARSRCMPLNYKAPESPSLQKTPAHSSKPMAGAAGPKGPADVDPMSIDESVTFEKVGGLENHLKCLKEIVVFPMLYREVFDQFKVQPPKGILFHGPPGTGKTLIARALANECSQGDRKVAFFMRKGADCLSKWVGESERQLRLLFEQAHKMRPSIIFFDEIDGLAPVRSSKQDQIHASIVSTLLALLDGLDDRGDIIVIGATNRIDAIDPALRRPGRFDRELYFPLPGKKERIEILRIHTDSWKNPPTEDLISDLAERSVGYCGADLRLLCSEAVIGAMRRRYPQVYKSSKKLLLQPEQVQVVDEDFREAHKKIIPASCRVTLCPRARLSPVIAPLLQSQFNTAINSLKLVFPQASSNERLTRSVYKPRFLVCAADGEYAQTSHLAPAILDYMEHIPVHVLGLDTLMDTTNRSPEEAVIQILREACRNPPAVVYLPAVDTWWDLLPPTTVQILMDRIAQIERDAAVLFLATAHSIYTDIDPQIQSLFTYDYIELRKPDETERREFWRPILTEEPLKEPPPAPVPEEEWEELPLAPPPPVLVSPSEAQEAEELHNAEEQRLRGLRLFLRDICGKLVRNRQFFLFSKPVDIREVPDYYNIIKRPMDLETMMTNIDLRVYNCAQEFLADIDLIVSNALEYNPCRDSEGKAIRHRACMLRDTAYTLIKAEMDTDFERECRKISKKRKEAKEKEMKTEVEEPNPTQPEPLCNGTSKTPEEVKPAENKKQKLPSTNSSGKPSLSDRVRRKKSNWARGMINRRKKVANSTAKTEEENSSASLPPGCNSEESKNSEMSSNSREVKRKHQEVDQSGESSALSESNLEGTPKKKSCRKSSRKLTITEEPGVLVDSVKLHQLHEHVTAASAHWNVDVLLNCWARIRRVVESYAEKYDREQLPKEIEDVFSRFSTAQNSSSLDKALFT